MASTVTRDTASGQTDSAKTTDVGRDVIDPTQGKLNYLTSDQGVKISDTDNWCVTVLKVPLASLMRNSQRKPQVENI
jgi:hypothetical protein